MTGKLRQWLWVWAAVSALGATVQAAELYPPAGVKWGSSPQEVGYLWQKYYKFLGPQEAPNPDLFLHEQRYEGNFLGLRSDHIAPLFFAGQLFSIAVSYSPDAQNPAAMIWETLVNKLEAVHGKPDKRTRPMQLLSFHAILKLLPPEVDKSALLALYEGADKDRRVGVYLLQDLQIQTGSWVPEAVWRFSNGAVLKAVMRAGGANQFGLQNLKPAVICNRYDQLK
jgi:hypothetical protein